MTDSPETLNEEVEGQAIDTAEQQQSESERRNNSDRRSESDRRRLKSDYKGHERRNLARRKGIDRRADD